MTDWLIFAVVLAFCLLFWVLFALKDPSSRTSHNGSLKSKPVYFWGALALVTVLSILIYRQLGASQELSLQIKMNELAEASAANPDTSFENAIELVRELEDATRAYPEKAEYWFLLASQRMAIERYGEAAEAYAAAHNLVPDDISILARQTEAEYIDADYRLTEDVQSLIDQVLSAEPTNSVVNGILGITAYRGGKFDIAIRFWERALSAMPPMSESAATMRSSIDQAQTMLANQSSGLDSSTEIAGAVEVQASENAAGAVIEVEVALADTLSFAPDTTVFVFVRQAGGPPMPIVVERTSVGRLPAKFVMDDSKVMIQGRVLADFPSLEVVARVSRSGQPTAQSGDYQAVQGPLSLESIDSPLSLVISELVP